MQDDLSRVEERVADVGRAMTEGLYHMCSDLIRISRGEPVEFAYRYADRYDVASTTADGAGEARAAARDDGADDARHDFALEAEAEAPDELRSVHMYREAARENFTRADESDEEA